MTAATQPASPRGGRRGRQPARRSRRRPVLLASDSGRDGESPSHNANVFFDVYQQVSGGGSFGRAQREDEQLLKHSVRLMMLKLPLSMPVFTGAVFMNDRE